MYPVWAGLYPFQGPITGIGHEDPNEITSEATPADKKSEEIRREQERKMKVTVIVTSTYLDTSRSIIRVKRQCRIIELTSIHSFDI